MKITCDENLNPPEVQAQNKLVIRVQVRYYNTSKYVVVYNDASNISNV